MNKNSITMLVVGLFVGMFVGFYAANALNRQAILQSNSATNATSAPQTTQQIQNASVKPSGPNAAMMPEIAETLDKAKNEPNNYQAQIKAGDMYAKIERFGDSVKFYEAAHKIKPEVYETIVKIGNTYFDAGDYDNAEKWYDQALAKSPKDVNVRTDLGITFVERENPDYDRAIKEFQNSLAVEPNHEATLYNLAIAYYKKENYDEAGKILTRLQSINPNSKLAGKLNQALINR